MAELHGRGMELAELAGHLAALSAGRGRGVTLVGPAGIGKTALLNAAADAARAVGLRVLRGRGSEAEREVPYGIIRHLLGPAVHDGELVVQGSAERGRALVLGEDLPPGTEASHAHDVYWLVADIAASGPLVLALDDLHWVDEASLRVLDLLRVRLDDLPVLLLAATRELPEGGWGSDAGMYQVPVTALSPAAVGATLRESLGDVPAALVEVCTEITGGNPFLLREVARTLRQAPGGAATDPAAVRSMVPAGILRSTDARLSSLGADARRLAQALSLLSDGASLVRAAAMADLDTEAASLAVDRMTANGLLAEDRPLRFAHPLLLAAVRDTIPSADRSRLHAHAARTLQTEPGGLALACAHLLEVVPAGDPEVVEVLRKGAARARVQGVPEAAVAYLRRAILEPPLPEDEAEVYLDLARVAIDVQVPDALELAQLAVDRATDPVGAVAAAIAAGHLITLAGRATEAIELLTAAYEAHPLPAPLAEAAMTLALAWKACSTAARGAEGPLVRDAQVLLDSPDAPLAIRALAAFEGVCGDQTAERSVELARRAWADGGLLREVGLGGPFVHFPVIVAALAGELGLVERWSERLMDEGTTLGSVHGRACGAGWRSLGHEARADLGAAEAYAAEALDLTGQASTVGLLLAVPVSVLARTALVIDGPEAAATALERLPTPLRDPQLMFSPWWWLARAEVALASGRYGDALIDLAEVELWQREWPATIGGSTMWHALAVEAHVALGDIDRARSVASVAVHRATAFGADRPLARALRAAALTLPVLERAPMLEEAIDLTRRGSCGVDGANYLMDLAETHIARGESAQAITRLEQAAEIAGRAGALALSDRVLAQLSHLAPRPTHVTTSPTTSLTAAERRVIDLASQSRTNREIAEALFLTQKTVETHLTSAYRKLGISSRHDLRNLLAGEI